ncbi:[FeFe] hydrogenase H-cluster radical SAM maturase HydE [Anaeromicropila populeti]|uniref:Iron-only hydrogenase maturation protein HydE n=1 Tax=Anaeromicropila populeti TaxID=37658 RepID=A0A1I6HKH9_9FIRM|nr:[FeFe] hydrogenase H-cluster radical SAM maturase HydE [Anaeromicropila populeti]SFR54847.1 iron-only hydrogenase maturation protein HydE [Anaeromicropila populeti]
MLVKKLIDQGYLSKEEYILLLEQYTQEDKEQLRKRALELKEKYYGKKVYTRGLIEFTNYCKNNCFYCGIQGKNKNVERYRLSMDEILECCQIGWNLGFRTFVLQGGEDPYFTDERIVEIVKAIKGTYENCAITLSIGEKSYEAYKKFREAGADRYLLRHESANEDHYKKLHPEEMTLQNRKECLYQLKELGFETGAGFMVGSPYQTNECLADDLIFLKELQPHMVGIGPFIPHHDTIFAQQEKGSLDKTLLLISVLRIILPKINLPATTALGTLDAKGREKGIQAGANVVMPNLSPTSVRKKYELYDNKICTGDEAAECRGCLQRRIESIGCEMVSERGDSAVLRE